MLGTQAQALNCQCAKPGTQALAQGMQPAVRLKSLAEQVSRLASQEHEAALVEAIVNALPKPSDPLPQTDPELTALVTQVLEAVQTEPTVDSDLHQKIDALTQRLASTAADPPTDAALHEKIDALVSLQVADIDDDLLGKVAIGGERDPVVMIEQGRILDRLDFNVWRFASDEFFERTVLALRGSPPTCVCPFRHSAPGRTAARISSSSSTCTPLSRRELVVRDRRAHLRIMARAGAGSRGEHAAGHGPVFLLHSPLACTASTSGRTRARSTTR
ncbi:MAG: hypothetical protein HC809_16775 [Gammaproteobacteria bacterium]|nr:hypothetical protein [Gammaproteobacteria bacterium]